MTRADPCRRARPSGLGAMPAASPRFASAQIVSAGQIMAGSSTQPAWGRAGRAIHSTPLFSRKDFYMKRLVTAVSAASLLAMPAFALTDTKPMSVSATVSASCSIQTTSDLLFGTVTKNTIDNVDTTAGTVDFICTKTTPWYVTTNLGTNASGSQRRMAGQADPSNNLLSYDVFTDTGRSVAFPTVVGTLGAGDTGGIGTGDPVVFQQVKVYGKIPSGQTLIPDTYLDTLVMTVNY
jgi:spore coat protein U-like protein